MYAQNKRNVTMIDDLPDLEDLESRPGMYGGGNPNMMGVGQHTPFQNQGPTGGLPEKFNKFIRTGMPRPPNESGMANYGGRQQQQQQQQQQQEFFKPPQQQEAPNRPPVGSPTCLEIADHVGACPICSRFYIKDNTVYIIAIVILAIICILLLKKVLNL
jgi:hypothetical protein